MSAGESLWLYAAVNPHIQQSFSRNSVQGSFETLKKQVLTTRHAVLGMRLETQTPRLRPEDNLFVRTFIFPNRFVTEFWSGIPIRTLLAETPEFERGVVGVIIPGKHHLVMRARDPEYRIKTVLIRVRQIVISTVVVNVLEQDAVVEDT